ncbi:lipopolysaccharide biosynthesis protein [Paludibacter sp. 221]|uniref:lipopolysaccharide biosynthesis protein n=1 Tax=Paludibacter sp. 221 TaxID=2302939 RepID=UPI0013D3FB4F|nr:MATE family efflux transporter [Paludibacter sp. 221]NDV47272.1 lipopolysaccharide biosynthesis protein [Paludibacter sp. 221]
MSENSNKKIAKNTVILYLRLFVTMLVSLYTSRIVLQVLGVQDYGTYTIVGGIVALFSFLNNAMTTATQRFLNFELGKKNLSGATRIFSMSLTTHVSIGIMLIILGETLGLWFLNTQINIPAERMLAANWVYQFSLLSFFVKIIRTPYQASIVAFEKFSFYAFAGIIEVALTLFVAFVLKFTQYDKLIIYGGLLFVVTVIINLTYWIYCRLKLEICHYKFFWNKSLYFELISFSGWSLFGSVANIGAQQGLNILVNIFYGVVVNAAMGIANQVTTAINSFVSNFQLAFNPQIVKSYAANDKEQFMSLVFRTSKYSYFLLFLISLPILLSMDYLLNIWLDNVPEYAAIFCQLMLIFCLTDAIAAPLWMSVQAIGQIRNYQLIISTIIFLNLPLSYIVLKLGYPVESVLYIRIFVNIVAFLFRIIYLQKKIQLNASQYIKDVVLRTIVVSLLSVIIPLVLKNYIDNNSIIGFILMTVSSILCTGLAIYLLGLNKHEKMFIKHTLLNKLRR